MLKYIQTLPNKPIHLDALLNKLFLDDTKDRIKAAIELIEWVLYK